MAVGETYRRVGVRACRRRGGLRLFNRARLVARSVLLAGKDGKPRRFAYADTPHADTPTRFAPADTFLPLRRILPPCLARLVKKQATLVVGNILLRPEQNRLLLPFLRRTEIPAFGVGGGQNVEHRIIFPLR